MLHPFPHVLSLDVHVTTRGSEAYQMSSHAATWSLLLPFQRIQRRSYPPEAVPHDSCCACKGQMLEPMTPDVDMLGTSVNLL